MVELPEHVVPYLAQYQASTHANQTSARTRVLNTELHPYHILWVIVVGAGDSLLLNSEIVKVVISQ